MVQEGRYKRFELGGTIQKTTFEVHGLKYRVIVDMFRRERATGGKTVVQTPKTSTLSNRRKATGGRLIFPATVSKTPVTTKPKTPTSASKLKTHVNMNTRNSTLLKNMNRDYLKSCYLNTYTTLAYVTGQTKMSDAVLARYMLSLETLLFKINGKLTGSNEKMLEDLWNKTRNYETKNTFSNDANIERVLTYYKNIMGNGFVQQGNPRITQLSRNLK